jgi:hypothetical protein
MVRPGQAEPQAALRGGSPAGTAWLIALLLLSTGAAPHDPRADGTAEQPITTVQGLHRRVTPRPTAPPRLSTLTPAAPRSPRKAVLEGDGDSIDQPRDTSWGLSGDPLRAADPTPRPRPLPGRQTHPLRC